MIAAGRDIGDLKRSPFPFSPLAPSEVPARISPAALDMYMSHGSIDEVQASRIWLDLDKRARLDAEDLEHLMGRAMTYAGALGQIDALHIEWGGTEWGVLEVWERLGRILREAGI